MRSLSRFTFIFLLLFVLGPSLAFSLSVKKATLGDVNLLYKNDANGKEISGSIDTLIAYVEAGYNINVSIYNEETKVRGMHQCHNVAVYYKTKKVICATSNMSMYIDNPDGTLEPRPVPYRWVAYFVTDGNLYASRPNVNAPGNAGTDIQKCIMQWYVVR